MARTVVLPKSVYKPLSVAHLNINSLKEKIHNVYYILRCRHIHVLALSETHLDPSVENSELSIRGYSLYRRDRDACGGGVALYVHAHIPAQLRPDLMLPHIEIIWVEAHLPGQRVLVGCCYRPPGAAAEYLDHICRAVEMLSLEHKDIFLLGDFNIDWLSSSSLKEQLEFATTDLGLTQVLRLPTRVTMNSYGQQTSSCIDHIYTNVPKLCSNPTSTATGCSDHSVIGVTVNRKAPRAQEEIVIQRSFSRFSPDSFISDVKAAQWNHVYEKSDPESALSSFIGVFCPIADRHAPLMIYRVKNNFAPWLDNETKSLMSDRDAAKARADASGSMRDWNWFLELKRDVCEINRDKKKEYFQQRLKEADHDVKSVWDTLNNFMGRNLICPVATIEVGGRLITEAADVATHLNQHYIEEMKELRSGLAECRGLFSSCSLIKERIMRNKQYSFSFTEVDVDRVKEVVSSLPEELPAGLDHLDVKLLTAAAEHISAPLCHILNRSLVSGVFPSQWKQCKVVPVPKNSNANFSAENSRAVCWLPVLSQVLEKMILDQIEQYFVERQLLTQGQCPVENMMDIWYRDLDSSRLVGALFLDLSASSDLISHDLLLDKLRLYGFSEAPLRLMRSYVSNRKQKVCYNGSWSEFGSVDGGLPRGSRLRPLLFSIFINDLLLDLEQATAVLCDHHMTLYYSACCRRELADVLEVELRAVQDWVEENRMVLKVSKPVVVGDRKTLFDSWQVVLSVLQVRLDHVNLIQLLGARLHQHLSWALHFNNITKKMEKDISLCKLCPSIVSQDARRSIVNALVLSRFDDHSVI